MNETLDLKPAPLKRPMDPSARGNDVAVLRDMCGLINNPLVTGAVVEQDLAAALLPPLPVKQQPVPAAATIPQRATALKVKHLFFTGQSKVGKSYLAAQLGARTIEFDDPIHLLAADAFGNVPDKTALNHFFAEVRAWGDGLVTNNYPLTASRAGFVEQIRSLTGPAARRVFGQDSDSFGVAGFWIRCLLSRVNYFSADFPAERLVVTDVTTPDQYTALKNAKFAPYHVTCNPLTRSSRGGNASTNPLADNIGHDLTTQLSRSPSGNKLWCVWNDDKYPSPSARLLTVPEFLQSIIG